MKNHSYNGARAAGPGEDIRLLLADVDGTLITSAKELTPATIRVARDLKDRGIALAITSSRPPRGLLQFIEALDITTPTGAFNGGTFVKPDLTIISAMVLPAGTAQEVVSVMAGHGLDVWVYSADEWYVLDLEGPHVARESRTVRFEPKVLDSYDSVIGEAVKIVGISDAPSIMAQAEAAVREQFGAGISATRSQTYYLDATPPDANKGMVLSWLADHLGISPESIATIGDGPNDVLMFERSGLSIAMGNAGQEVKAAATMITSSNDEDGFARAVETRVLPQRYASTR